MSGIVEKIKDRVRSRSRSRSRGQSISSDNRASYIEDGVPKTPVLPSQYQNYPRSSLENSAFHVTSARGLRKSLDNDPFQQRVADNNHPVEGMNRSSIDNQEYRTRGGTATPERGQGSRQYNIQNSPRSDYPTRGMAGADGYTSNQPTSPRQTDRSHIRVVSQDQGTGMAPTSTLPGTSNPNRNETIDGSVIPPRTDSLQQSGFQDDSAIRRKPIGQMGQTGLTGQTGQVGQVAGNGTPQKPSLTMRHDPEMEKLKAAAFASGHLKLPAGFSLQNTEHTYVSEEQRPAVTHETVVRERTEIVQEAISREVHVHHYYTYTQPIKVVEVLPAKHYFLNSATGEKREIAAPAQWQLPATMLPATRDYSTLGGYTRHYVVDEEHPTGMLEEPTMPVKHERGHENLREATREATHSRRL